MTIFSGFRSPQDDEARCAAEGNCQGIVRARCSAHRTGLALDLALEPAPGRRVDDAADDNRLFMSRTAAYRWLVANAGRFGFVNYIFEPWHWEWTGEAPLPMSPGTVWPPQPLSPQTQTVEPVDASTPSSPQGPGPRRDDAGPGGLQPGTASVPAAKGAKAGGDADKRAQPAAGGQPDAAQRGGR